MGLSAINRCDSRGCNFLKIFLKKVLTRTLDGLIWYQARETPQGRKGDEMAYTAKYTTKSGFSAYNEHTNLEDAIKDAEENASTNCPSRVTSFDDRKVIFYMIKRDGFWSYLQQ